MTPYEQVQHRLAQGWNTWNTHSVCSYVHLPEGFAINLGFKNYETRHYLDRAFIGQKEEKQEQIQPGPRTYNGSYMEFTMDWEGMDVEVRAGLDGEDFIALVTLRSEHRKAPLLVVEPAILWNREGYTYRAGDELYGQCGEKQFSVFTTQPSVFEPNIPARMGYLALELTQPVGVSTGKPRSVAEIAAVLDRNKAALQTSIDAYGDLADVYAAVHTVMAWDTIYDPENQRVISPVSRQWNLGWGGFVLFDWDTYFAAYLAAVDNPDLAYANAIEITNEITERGFIPNFACVNDIKSRDRSQPPVGSIVVREIYRLHGGKWFLEKVFDKLLTWNRWWTQNRDAQGYLCWGSEPYEPVVDGFFEVNSTGDHQGAAFESGLDNSPMYDDIPFNEQTWLMELADVGLMGMYVRDCEALAEIAAELGHADVVEELTARAECYRSKLSTLWDDASGMFLNRRTDTGDFSHRLSPTNFYALLGKAASQEQAERMIAEHFYNPDEFWGEWIMPSIARNDLAYPDQAYWRGRIWAPMNFLVYLGLWQYDLPQVRADLARKSAELLLKEWREKGHVHENYSGDTGEGCDKWNSDRFYHWGALLGLIALIEAGVLPAPKNSD